MLNPSGDFVGQDTFKVSKIKEFSHPVNLMTTMMQMIGILLIGLLVLNWAK